MRHGRPDGSPYSRPVHPPAEKLEEQATPGRTGAGEDVSFRDRDEGRTEVQRVGGRRRIRPEVLLVLAGSAFVLAALLKPWPSSPPATGASPASSGVAAFSTGPAASEQPGDYRFPVPSTDQPPEDSSGITSSLTQRWAAVDWTLLNAVDQHDTWGFGTAILPDLTTQPPGATPPSPALSWVAAIARPDPTVLRVASGGGVFALNVTWPSTVKVTGITFRYLGGPDHPPYQPPVGFPSFTEVSPIPATQVATPIASATPSATPTATPTGGGALLRSGQFWIPPSEASWNAATTSVPVAWHTLPWPWPDGTFRVTLDTTTGPTAYLLTIQETA